MYVSLWNIFLHFDDGSTHRQNFGAFLEPLPLVQNHLSNLPRQPSFCFLWSAIGVVRTRRVTKRHSDDVSPFKIGQVTFEDTFDANSRTHFGSWTLSV